MDDSTGQLFGHYRLIQHIGEGSFADVYLGEHVKDRHQAAIKLLDIKLTDIDDLKSFINEARTTLYLTHPNIVRLLDFGIGENDIPFLVMFYAPNGTLRSRHPRNTRLPLAIIVDYVKQIAAALQFAHDQALVHRDVKPENILLGAADELLLSDFGIASVAHNTKSLNIQDSAGTIPYMAPEQLQGKPCTASDQYAVGIMVYEWLCGEVPFQGTFHEIGSQHMVAPPASLVKKVPGLSTATERIVMTALAKDPKDRFPTISAFADALEKQYIAELLSLSGITIDFLLLELRKSTSYEDETTEQTLVRAANSDADAAQAEVEHLVRKSLGEVHEERWPQLIDLTDALKQAALEESHQLFDISFPSDAVHFKRMDFLSKSGLFNFREIEEVLRGAVKAVRKQDLPQLINLVDTLKQSIQATAEQKAAVLLPSDLSDIEQKLDILSLFPTVVIGKLHPHEEEDVEHISPQDNIENSPPQPQIFKPQPSTNSSGDTSSQSQIPKESSSTVLFPSSVAPEGEQEDFFILYHRADYTWAMWIAWQLQEEGYSVILPPWPLHMASNFRMELQKATAKAKRTLLILSPDSLKVLDVQPAHIALLKRKSTDGRNRVRLICVRECGDRYLSLLDSLQYVDLTGVNKPTAQVILLASIKDESIKLIVEPPFPGDTSDQTVSGKPVPPPAPIIPTQSIEIFFAYSHKDKELRDELEHYLTHLKRPSEMRAWQIKAWHDGEIRAGDDYAREILNHLSKAHIILLIISQDFIVSDYCYNTEMEEALKRHDKGQARVIPIIAREASWEDTPIKNLQVLPEGAKPINSRTRREKTLKKIARGIEKEIEKLLNP